MLEILDLDKDRSLDLDFIRRKEEAPGINVQTYQNLVKHATKEQKDAMLRKFSIEELHNEIIRRESRNRNLLGNIRDLIQKDGGDIE